MKPFISIIVPVYKSEKCIQSLISSILSQTYTDWELILIDDGSPDQSGVLCDRLSAKDSRIITVHKENGGISSACNAGIDAAKGTWFFFCDHDDYLTPDSLTLLAEIAQDPEIDLIAASYIRFREDVLQEDTHPGESKKVTVKQYHEGTCDYPDIRYNEYYLWNKLLRSSIIKTNNIRFFDNIHYFQDVLFAYQYLFSCTGYVYCLDKPIYVYFKRDTGESSSITHKYNPKKSPGRLYSQIHIYESFMEAPIFFSNKAESFLKNKILLSYFWLQHSILHSGFAYWPDIKKYMQATQPYYSRRELVSRWVFRHIRLRLGQLRSLFARLFTK